MSSADRLRPGMSTTPRGNLRAACSFFMVNTTSFGLPFCSYDCYVASTLREYDDDIDHYSTWTPSNSIPFDIVTGIGEDTATLTSCDRCTLGPAAPWQAVVNLAVMVVGVVAATSNTVTGKEGQAGGAEPSGGRAARVGAWKVEKRLTRQVSLTIRR